MLFKLLSVSNDNEVFTIVFSRLDGVKYSINIIDTLNGSDSTIDILLENDDFDPEESSGDIDDFKYELNLEEGPELESGYYDFDSIQFEVDEYNMVVNSTIKYSENYNK